MNRTFKIAVLLLSLTLGQASAYADLGLTFKTKLNMNLCPEYPFGGLSVEVYYSIASNQVLYPVQIESQTVNSLTNTAVLEFSLPFYFGKLPINVYAYCRGQRGLSRPSNSLSITACDVLAKLDSDGDGIPNNLEDTNCDTFFSPGDASNPFNMDTDGDGVLDLVEIYEGSDPANPGSSPRPFIYSSAPFDPDQNNFSNPIVWRPTTGTFYIKDFPTVGASQAVEFGKAGDIPFTYKSAIAPSDVGVIRKVGSELHWLFHGSGFVKSDFTTTNLVNFGVFGDNIILGPWEKPGVTNPAVARLFNNSWSFAIYLSNGGTRFLNWGQNGDIPRVQDYDGDSLFDIALYRPSEQKIYVIESSSQQVKVYAFGTGSADITVRGDYTGDGIDDISFWEPLTGTFFAMISDNGFDDQKAAVKDPDYYFGLQLGVYYTHLPLNWNLQNGRLTYTVVNHAQGFRHYRLNNNINNFPTNVQWGLAGDHQG